MTASFGQPVTSRRRWIFFLIYAVYVVSLLGVGYRAYLWLVYSVAPADLSNKIDPYRLHYPELYTRNILQSSRSPDELQVLLLGGSVAEQVGDALSAALTQQLNRPVRVHNAAVSAHTTRDSLNKLQWLCEQGAGFDLIVIYHGINEVRMNCIPDDAFRDDYAHCQWYRSFDRLKRHRTLSMGNVAEDTLDRTIGLGPPDIDAFEYGAKIKTGPAFHSNLEQMIAMAHEHQTPVVLMTFATYWVDNYSREAMEAGTLGYARGQYGLATELWGAPENVHRGVNVHNEQVVAVARKHPEELFVDMASALTELPLFSDVCHLSPAGIDRFVEILSSQLATDWKFPTETTASEEK